MLSIAPLLSGIDEVTAEEILASFYRDQEVPGEDESSASPLKVSLPKVFGCILLL